MAPRKRPPKRDISDLTGLRVGLYVRVSQDKAGEEKSTEDQKDVGVQWAGNVGAAVADVYSDPDYSASRYATKQRPEFARLLADIKAGKLDVVWFWELSRSQRRLDVFAELRDLCRDLGVVWVIRDRPYDPADYKDMLTLGMLSVIGENESEMTSERVKRGMASLAANGKPGFPAPFGYRRRYDHTSAKRKIIAQEPDVWDGDGRPVQDSPAWVVKEIFTRLAAGDAMTRIARDLTDRQIPRSRTANTRWDVSLVKRIAMNPVYIAKRVHRADWSRPYKVHEAIVEGVTADWPPLVDEETFWTVYRTLADPARRRTRPFAAKSLLSFLVTCDKCGGPVCSTTNGRGRRTYACRDRGCANIAQHKLDDYAEEITIRWLSDPDVFAELTRVDDSALAAHARTEANQLRLELEQLYADAEAGDVSAVIATRREKVLKEQIAEAEQRALHASMPPVLVGRIGPEAAAAWASAELDIRRQIVAAVAEIRLKPTGATRAPTTVRLADVAKRAGVSSSTVSDVLNGGKDGYAPATRDAVLAAVDELGYDYQRRTGVNPPVHERVGWRWLLGPDAG